MGQRVKLSLASSTTIYLSKYYTVATTTSAATTTKYIFGGDTLFANIDGNGTATSTRYVHPDHLGSTNVVTDSNGTTVQTLDYYPYGTTRIDSGTDVSDREFIGERFDESTNLSYLNSRYYSGDRGQFLSQDPTFLTISDPNELRRFTQKEQMQFLIDPQQLNSYSYARNNPIVNKDPQGNFAFAIPLYYAAVTAPEWGPWVGAAILGTGAFLANEFLLRQPNGIRYGGEFDARRLPPSHLMGPESPLEVKPPNFNN